MSVFVHQADLPADMQSRVRQPASELMRNPVGCVDAAVPLSAAHNYGRPGPGSELLNSYLDPTGIQQSFKTPCVGSFPVGMQRWDGYPEDDDYSDDGYSDRELSGPSRQQPPSHLLPACSQSPMFNASRPYLCSSSVIDRMCATFGQQPTAAVPNLDRFAASYDRLAADSRTGGVIHSQFAAQSVDHSANFNPFVGADPMENERVLFDGEVEHLASDDDPFRDTESRSPVVEEDSWQCVVEDGEVELT